MPSAFEEGEKPTFLFGSPARSQLVDPIEGDGHFENAARTIEELLAGSEQTLEAVDRDARPPAESDDRNGPKEATVVGVERLQQEPGENRAELIRITVRSDSARSIQTMAAPGS